MKAVKEYKYLYTLSYVDPIDQETYVFYVGKTNRKDGRGQDHRRAWKNGTEDKYVFIREVLEPAHIEWTYSIFKEVPKDTYVEDWERWWVIDYVRKGHPIQNMKHGDLDTINEQVANVSIRSVQDVRQDRERREREKFERSEKLREKILADKKEAEEADEGMADLLDRMAHARSLRNKVRGMLKDAKWEKVTSRADFLYCEVSFPQGIGRTQIAREGGWTFYRGRTTDALYFVKEGDRGTVYTSSKSYADAYEEMIRNTDVQCRIGEALGL